MSEQQPHEPTASVPHAWAPLIVALTAVVVAAVATGVLMVRYLDARPLNLTPETEQAAASLEALLAANRVPAESVQRTGPVAQAPEHARWNYYEYDVAVPDHLDADGMEDLIAQRMGGLHQSMLVEDLVENGRKAGLELAFGDFTFAKIRIQPDRTPLPARPMESPPPSTSPAPGTDDTPEPSAASGPGDDTLANLASAALDQFASQGSLYSDPPAVDTLASVANVDTGMDVIEPGEGVEAVWTPPHHVAPDAPAAPDVPVTPPKKNGSGKLAIIIDDGGYGGAATEIILGLSPKLTLAILPNTPHGTDIAERARAAGFEVMLHMPMENLDPKLFPHEGQLNLDMTDSMIRELTEAALAQVPGAVGVNNHMGSRYTGDAKYMALFMDAIADKGLFFVDSRTTADSRAFEVARAFDVPSETRDLFLDHVDDAAQIRARFWEVVKLAQQNGEAIAIGHFRPATAAVLAELLPQLPEYGVELVHASELVD